MGDLILTGQTTSMPRAAISALADPPSFGVPASWNARQAESDMRSAGIDPGSLLADMERLLQPVESNWLAERLRILWKSSTPAQSLDATVWLHETGRLLSDLPKGILASAIDEAVKTSTKGFMPGVGQIRAIAEPEADLLRRNVERLRMVVNYGSVGQIPYRPRREEDGPNDQVKAMMADLVAKLDINR